MKDIITDNYKLLHGDCLERMKEIDDGSVDLILTDPPFQVTQNKWDKIIPFELMWEQLKRIIKPNGAIVLFGCEPFSSALRMSNAKDYKYDWVWDKSQVTGFLNAKKQPLRQHELISVFYSKQCNYYPIMTKGKRQLKNTGGKSSNYGKYTYQPHYSEYYYPKSIINFPQQRIKGGHPTQKPCNLA